MTVRQMLRKGEFNYMTQIKQSDGSVLVILIRRGDPKIYKLWVKDLYKSTETIVKQEVT
jgi:penicillin-binding protein-related factor A (putative recombinase)